MHYAVSNHAEVRMKQRGKRMEDVSLVLDAGTRVAPDAYFMTNQDVEREIARRKREIQRLEHLRGLKVVVEGDAIVTCYNPSPRNRKRTHRRGRSDA